MFLFVDDHIARSCLSFFVYHLQVSSVTDHVGGQDTTAKSADLDDDEGGLVS